MNQTNVRVRYLDLEASNADAETVSALVGIVSQVQSGKALPTVTAASVETFVDAAPARELPAPKAKRVYKPRPPKAAPAATSTKPGDIIMAAVRKNPRVDRAKLAIAAYGDDPKGVNKVGQMLCYFVKREKLANNGDGTYTVLG